MRKDNEVRIRIESSNTVFSGGGIPEANQSSWDTLCNYKEPNLTYDEEEIFFFSQLLTVQEYQAIQSYEALPEMCSNAIWRPGEETELWDVEKEEEKNREYVNAWQRLL